MDGNVVELVWQRALSRCEYCLLPASCSEAPFQIDHIIARKHRGSDEPSNLALACYYCNSYKGPNISGIDPVSGRMVRLFHPRCDRWADHFRFDAAIIVGKTAIGRATVDVLWVNHPALLEIRTWLLADGHFL